jgi:lysylphosphatidylglycerol synthetase-like protein (DUF2156 family)
MKRKHQTKPNQTKPIATFYQSNPTTAWLISNLFIYFESQSALNMSNPSDPLQQVHEIRSIMERSSRFISLSGLSGVVAGVTALVGAALAYKRLGSEWSEWRIDIRYYNMETFIDLVLIAVGVLVVAVGFGLVFTIRHSKRKGQQIWDKTGQRLILNLVLPLVVGGLYCLILMSQNYFYLVAPSTLIFYGLALVNASKYTLNDIRWLGLCEIGLGLLGTVYLGYGLVIWAIGFGFLHIIYGTAMWWKYEK